MPEEKLCITKKRMERYGKIIKKIGTVPDEDILKEFKALKEEIKKSTKDECILVI